MSYKSRHHIPSPVTWPARHRRHGSEFQPLMTSQPLNLLPVFNSISQDAGTALFLFLFPLAVPWLEVHFIWKKCSGPVPKGLAYDLQSHR